MERIDHENPDHHLIGGNHAHRRLLISRRSQDRSPNDHRECATTTAVHPNEERCAFLIEADTLVGEIGVPAFYFFGHNGGIAGGANVDAWEFQPMAEVLQKSIERGDGTLDASPIALDVIASYRTLEIAADAYDNVGALETEGDLAEVIEAHETAYAEADALLDQARVVIDDTIAAHCST